MHTLYEEKGNGCLSLTYNDKFNMWLMHLPTIENWTISEYKRYLKIFKNVLKQLRFQGIKELANTPI